MSRSDVDPPAADLKEGSAAVRTGVGSGQGGGCSRTGTCWTRLLDPSLFRGWLTACRTTAGRAKCFKTVLKQHHQQGFHPLITGSFGRALTVLHDYTLTLCGVCVCVRVRMRINTDQLKYTVFFSCHSITCNHKPSSSYENGHLLEI